MLADICKNGFLYYFNIHIEATVNYIPLDGRILCPQAE